MDAPFTCESINRAMGRKDNCCSNYARTQIMPNTRLLVG